MYDVLVIGSDLSSMIAALTSARAGFKTVLVMEGEPEMAYRENGYTFPFHSKPLFGHLNRQKFSQLFENIDVSGTDISRNENRGPLFQIILPGHRIDRFQDQQTFIDDLIREYPTKKQAIEHFHRNIQKTADLVDSWIDEDLNDRSGFLDKMIKFMKRLPHTITGKFTLMNLSKEFDGSLRRIISAQLAYLSHLEMTKDHFSFPEAYLLGLPNRGLFCARGGLMSWMSQLRLLFQHYGGTLIDGCSTIRIETQPAVTVDLEKEGTPSTLRGKKLIVSSQWEKLEILLPSKKILPETNRPFSSIRVASYPFCLHIGVRDECLPESMAPYAALLLDHKNPLVKGNFAFLQTSLQGDVDRAPEGRRAITATVYLAESPLRLSDQDLKNVATELIDSLEFFLPFLRESIDFLRVDQSISFSRKCQEIVSRIYQSRRQPFWGLKILVPKTRLPNVTLTGGILRPGIGFEGEILAGLDAAFHVQKELKCKAVDLP